MVTTDDRFDRLERQHADLSAKVDAYNAHAQDHEVRIVRTEERVKVMGRFVWGSIAAGGSAVADLLRRSLMGGP